VVSVKDPYGYILGFQDRCRYFFFLSSSSSVVLTTLYYTVLVVTGIEPGTSGSVARNYDHYTTEVV
jgi:hypothetical protein